MLKFLQKIGYYVTWNIDCNMLSLVLSRVAEATQDEGENQNIK